MTYMELWARMEWLARKVAAGMPAGSPVAVAFAAVTADHGDDWTPPVPVLKAAHAAWLALPAETRRRLMHGWTYSPAYPSPAALLNQEMEYGGIAFNHRALKDVGGRVFGYRTAGVEDAMPAPIRLLIVEGTTQAEAIATIERALRVVRNQWPELVGPDIYVDEKSGTPEASGTPSLGGGMGTLMLAPTAA